ncbi:hypothetical protein ACFL5Q_01085 [Planctomycetota bacterium]
MQTNRRQFLAGGMGSLAAAAASGHTSRADDPVAGAKPDQLGDMSCLGYGLSFITNSAAFNSVRFWVESRTTVIDDAAGLRSEFYQCASCKSENTFAEENLFHEDNYDFLPILGDGQWLIFRRPVGLSDNYRQVKAAADVWGEPVLKLREAKRVTLLDTWEKIRDASAEGKPIVSQTEIRGADTGLRAIVECPVKTLNVSIEREVYQVDTGPVGFPDLARRYENLIECLSLAFVAFNAPHFADFIIEQPTAVVEDEEETCQIYHYSQPFSLSAGNRLLAVELPG